MRISMQRVGGVLGVCIAALLQATPWVALWGVKPNILFVALVIVAVSTESISMFAGVVVLGTAIAYNVSFISWGAAVSMLVSCGSFFLVRRLPWRTLMNIVSVIAVGTAGFYILIAPTYVFQEMSVVLLEVLYNVLIGVGLYVCFAKGDGMQQGTRRW